MIDLLKARGGGHIQVFGGGGGVIVPTEMDELHAYGVTHLYSVEEGQALGLQGMINDMVVRCDKVTAPVAAPDWTALERGDRRVLSQTISALENDLWTAEEKQLLWEKAAAAMQHRPVPILGVTGTGGAGKSSLTDELIRRIRLDQQDRLRLAVISIDPSRKRTGGALLGDRIRMNAIGHPNIYMRSLATRNFAGGGGGEISRALPATLAACKISGFDLIIVETSGIGQGDAAIVPLVCDDARVWRGVATGKNRHAGFCGFCRHQQVRPQGRGRCAARCAEAISAQPQPFRRTNRGNAGVWHHGRAL